MYEELGDRYGILQACLTLGELNRQLDDATAARQFCRRAVAVAQEIGDRSGEADGYYRLGQIASGLGERDEALRLLHIALEQAHAIHETQTTLDILLEIACLLIEAGETMQAQEILYFLLSHPQLPEQRRARGRAALARLASDASGSAGMSLEQIVVRAISRSTAQA